MEYLFKDRADFNDDISRWNLSSCLWMRGMFEGATSFNVDISQWDVSKVTNMNYMLHGASSFTHQLCGAWLTSTATKINMFYKCPGSIAGKAKNAYGTVV